MITHVIYSSGLLVNSPGQDQSIGRMNQSFSRTKIAASLPHSEKSIMDDAKKQLFLVCYLLSCEDSDFCKWLIF